MGKGEKSKKKEDEEWVYRFSETMVADKPKRDEPKDEDSE